MSQMVAVSSPASGREMLERAAMLRRSFFPQRFAPRPPRRVRIEPVIVYAAPVEISSPPAIDLAREAREIAALIGKRVRVIDIICAAAEHFDLRKIDLLASRRTRRISRPRQIVMFLSKEMTTRSLPEIGRLLGGKDHTTILHGWRKVASLIAAGDPIASDVEAIRARLLA